MCSDFSLKTTNGFGAQIRLHQRYKTANGFGAQIRLHYDSDTKSIFLDEVASSKLNLHGGFFRK